MHSASVGRTASPAPGDVIIAGETKGAKGLYVLSEFPGPPQIQYGNYDQALTTATRWATQRAVAVWQAKDRELTLLVPRLVPLHRLSSERPHDAE